MKRPLVLIVDDSVDVVRLLGLILAESCDVIFAKEGQRALDLARDRLPSLILLDVEMPGMDGRQAWSALHEQSETRGIPVIFVSADDPRPELHDTGEVGWIRKPFTALDVQTAVHACVGTVSSP